MKPFNATAPSGQARMMGPREVKPMAMEESNGGHGSKRWSNTSRAIVGPSSGTIDWRYPRHHCHHHHLIFEWRRYYGIVSPIKDQGSCGCCWAFGAAAVAESAWAKQTGTLTSSSTSSL